MTHVAVITSDGVGRSAVYREYKSDPRTLPCGIPELIGKVNELTSRYLTLKVLLVRYDSSMDSSKDEVGCF